VYIVTIFAHTLGARELKRKKLHFMPMYPMFPANELRLAGDKFGQFIDRQQFEQPAVLETEEVPVPGDAAAEHGADDGVSEKEDAEQKAEEEDSSLEDATKTLFEPVVLSVKCAVHYIDFDGRSDGKSIRQFCKQMLPRRVILIGSAAKDKEALRDFIVDSKIVSSELMCNVPSNLQQISATSDLKMAKLHVDDDLFARLQFTAVGGTGYEAAWVTGNALPVENNPHLIQLSALAPAAAQQGDVPSPHPLVCLGVVQLARVKHILNDSGVSADFAPGGVLACGPSGQVQVEKVGKSRVRIKGALCEAYFRVRELLYSEFELV
jgi:cleavage and polyadenylation specificity factor subunit 2